MSECYLAVARKNGARISLAQCPNWNRSPNRMPLLLRVGIPWLALLHLINELLRTNVIEIATRRGQRAMAKLSLDHVHRLALGCQLGGERVAEPVRVALVHES